MWEKSKMCTYLLHFGIKSLWCCPALWHYWNIPFQSLANRVVVRKDNRGSVTDEKINKIRKEVADGARAVMAVNVRYPTFWKVLSPGNWFSICFKFLHPAPCSQQRMNKNKTLTMLYGYVAYNSVFWPNRMCFLPKHPDIPLSYLEINCFTDIGFPLDCCELVWVITQPDWALIWGRSMWKTRPNSLLNLFCIKSVLDQRKTHVCCM